MLFTVITVVFNSASTILDTLYSVSSQQESKREHIIVDGGSTDGTLSILQSFDSPLINIISEPDTGIYNAMNKGIRLANGDIIGFLNADDIYANSSALSIVLSAFESNPDADIVYGDLVYVKYHDVNQTVRKWKSRSYYPSFFEDGYVPPHPAFFVKRKVLMETGGFDEHYWIAADYELMFRLLKIENRKSIYLPKVLVRMRLGGASNSTFTNIRLGNREIISAWKKHNQRIPIRFWLFRYIRKLVQFFVSE